MASTDYFYQTVGFHFAVSFNGGNLTGIDAAFQSVSGLDVTLEVESIKEGGENRNEHIVPSKRKYSDLVLKRGLVAPDAGSKITEWCLNAFEGFSPGGGLPKRLLIEPLDLSIILLNENHQALMQWDVIHAWPKAWKFGELNAEKSEVLIETLELRYNRFEFKSS